MRSFGTKLRAAVSIAAVLFGFAFALPAAAQSTGTDDDFVYYFQRGDTLIRLGRRLLVQPERWHEVQLRNGIGDPLRIPPGTPLRIPQDWLRLAPYAVTVGVVSGHVTRGGAPVQSGESLAEGSVIETAADGAVTLHLADGSVVTLQKSSKLELQRLRKVEGVEATHSTRLKLESGRVETVVPPRQGMGRLDIATPVAVSAVRGTRFRTSHAGAAGTNETLEGSVAVSNALSAVAVPAGFGTRIERDTPPLAPRPLLPAPDLTGLPEVNSGAEFALTLPPVEGARQYRVQLATDPSFQSIVDDRITDSPALSVPLADGKYWLRARAIDAHGIEGFDAVRPVEQARAPSPPALLSPASTARTTDRNVRFQWGAAESADAYQLQVARDPGFAEIVVDERLVATSFDAAGLPVGRYYWRVMASNPRGGAGAWSEPRSFEQRPAPPEVEAPEIDRHSITLRWSAASGGPYRVQIARDAGFERIVADVVSATPEATVMKPFPGIYHVRVQVVAADGQADPFGPARRVDVPLPPWVPVLLFSAVLVAAW